MRRSVVAVLQLTQVAIGFLVSVLLSVVTLA